MLDNTNNWSGASKVNIQPPNRAASPLAASERDPSSTKYPVHKSRNSDRTYTERAKYVLGRLGTTVASRVNIGPSMEWQSDKLMGKCLG